MPIPPIHYLVLIGQIEVLTVLYGRVVIPTVVCRELLHPSTPEPVRQWMEQPPEWLEIRSPLRPPDASLARLDAGERDAIVLAEELAADLIILDDRVGRREAEARRLSVIGTLGVLAQAADEGLLDLREVLQHLEQTSFRVSSDVLKRLLPPS